MPIDRIPILPADYPLFDWDDHLQSYYALGEGELVAGFQKETWNAIIDKTLEALDAAGMNWDTRYTASNVAKITKAYGPLTAKMFNSVRYNIDRPAPVGWGWANNPNLRGYVGREDFKGYGDHGLNGDYFYAEYLLEMVRRLNLMLSIMKGTANLKEMAAPIMSQTDSVRNLLAKLSAPMAFSEPAFSSFVCGLMAKCAGQFHFMGKARTLDHATVSKFRAKQFMDKERSFSLQKSQLQMPISMRLSQFMQSIPSVSQAEMDVFNALYLSSGFGLSYSQTWTNPSILLPRRLISEVKSTSNISATQLCLSPQPILASEITTSATDTAIHVATAKIVEAKSMGRSSMDINFETIRPRRMSVKTIAGAKCIAILDSAWFTPIWVNGKLYIRQAHEANQTDATLEVR